MAKKFYLLMSFYSLWDVKICKQKFEVALFARFYCISLLVYFNINTTSGLCHSVIMVFESLDGICKSVVGSLSLMSMLVIILELFDSGDGDLTLGLGSRKSSFSSLRTVLLSTLVSETDY